MSDKKTYTVHRGMHGDGRDYQAGDTRELDELDAAPLVESGALALVGETPNVRAPAVKNAFGKAEPTGHLSTTSATTDERMRAVKADTVAAKPGLITEPKVVAKA